MKKLTLFLLVSALLTGLAFGETTLYKKSDVDLSSFRITKTEEAEVSEAIENEEHWTELLMFLDGTGWDKSDYETDDGWFVFAETDNGYKSIQYKEYFDEEKDRFLMTFLYTEYKKKSLKKQTIKRSGDVKISDGKRAGVNTASTRASDAKEDLIWDED